MTRYQSGGYSEQLDVALWSAQATVGESTYVVSVRSYDGAEPKLAIHRTWPTRGGLRTIPVNRWNAEMAENKAFTSAFREGLKALLEAAQPATPAAQPATPAAQSAAPAAQPAKKVTKKAAKKAVSSQSPRFRTAKKGV